MAVLPANIKEATVYSHQGLTYGGLVLHTSIGFSYVSHIFDSVLAFLKKQEVEKLIVKQLPDVYQKRVSQELYYLLNKSAKIVDTQMVLAIDYSKPLQIHKTKQKYFKKGEQQGFEIRKEQNFDVFWNEVLIPRLSRKHNVLPVHSVNEILYLQSKFPNYIYQYNIYYNNRILAGITIFETDQVVKSQYGATTEEGEKFKAYDYLFLYLIYLYKDKKKYFSQGTVTERNDIGYNSGLLKQKEELGCEVYVQNTYEIEFQ